MTVIWWAATIKNYQSAERQGGKEEKMKKLDIMFTLGNIMRILNLLFSQSQIDKIGRTEAELVKFLQDEGNAKEILKIFMAKVPFKNFPYNKSWYFPIRERALSYSFDNLFIPNKAINRFLTEKTKNIKTEEGASDLECFKINLEFFLGKKFSEDNIRKLLEELNFREMSYRELIVFYFQYDSIPVNERILVSAVPVFVEKKAPVFLTVENTKSEIDKSQRVIEPAYVRKIDSCMFCNIPDNMVVVKK